MVAWCGGVVSCVRYGVVWCGMELYVVEWCGVVVWWCGGVGMWWWGGVAVWRRAVVMMVWW